MRFVLSLALLAVLFPVQASAQVSWRTAMETVREKQETYRQTALDKNPAAVRAGNSPEALEGLRQFHGCAIIGRIVGQTDAIREMESFDDPDLETSSAETLFLHSEFLRAWVEAADGVLALSADQRSSVWDDLCVENYGRVHGLERLNELNEERPYTNMFDDVAPAEEKRMLEENAAELLQAAIAAERENVRYFVESVTTEFSERIASEQLFAQIDDRYFVVKGVSEAGMMGLMRFLGRDEAPSGAEPVPEAWVNENEISAELMQKIRQGEVITDPRFKLNGWYSFDYILDLNGDGYDELIFSESHAAREWFYVSLFLATHIGGGAFSIYDIGYGRDIDWSPTVKFTQIGSKIAFSLETVYPNSLSSVSTSYILKDEGELLEIDEQLTSYAGDIIAPLEIWNDVDGTDVDLNFDGEPEHISHRFGTLCLGALVMVRSHDFRQGDLYGGPLEGDLLNACCPALGVLNSVTNGYRDLVCNRSEVYRFNGGYYN